MPRPRSGRQATRRAAGDTHARFRNLHVRQLIDGAPELTPDEQAEYARLSKLPELERICTSPNCAGSCTWRYTPRS